MMRLMNLLMLSCRKATELMEKKNRAPLKALETLQLFMHTRMCDACTQYEKQSHFIDNLLKKQGNTPDNLQSPQKTLSDEAKALIIRELEKM